MVKHTVQLATCSIEIDDTADVDIIRRRAPLFFATSFGSRETIDSYRGFLIVRYTVRYSGGASERRTAVHAFTMDLEGSPGVFCVSGGQDLASAAQARRLIDRILETGRYERGMTF